MLQQLKELRSHLDIAAAAGLGSSRADNNINELESWSEGTELSRRHVSPSRSKPSTSQMELISQSVGNAPRAPTGSSKKLVRGPKSPKPLVASACSPARTPRRGLWGGTERRDLSTQRPSGAVGKSEGSRAPSSSQASSISFQDMLQHQDTGERFVKPLFCLI